MKNIKSYKLFLDSLNESLYKDDEYILHGLFTPLYDKYFDIKVERGWIDDNNEFQLISPGKNRRLGYSVVLSGKQEFTEEDIDDCISNIEFDDMKVIKQKGLTFIIDALKTSDITIDDVIKYEFNLTKEQYLEIEKWFLEILNTSVVKEEKNYFFYIYQDEKIMAKNKRNSYFSYDYDRIYLVLRDNFKVNQVKINGLMKYMVETHTEWKDVTPAFYNLEMADLVETHTTESGVSKAYY